jgi:hypothetical protein
MSTPSQTLYCRGTRRPSGKSVDPVNEAISPFFIVEARPRLCELIIHSIPFGTSSCCRHSRHWQCRRVHAHGRLHVRALSAAASAKRGVAGAGLSDVTNMKVRINICRTGVISDESLGKRCCQKTAIDAENRHVDLLARQCYERPRPGDQASAQDRRKRAAVHAEEQRSQLPL